MAPNGIRHKADAVKPQIPKPIKKLLVPKPGGQGIPKAFAFKTKVTFHNIKEADLYSAYCQYIDHTELGYLQIHHICLSFV